MSATPPARARGDSSVVVRRAAVSDARPLLALMWQLAHFEGYAAQFAVTERDLVERGLGTGATPQFTALVAEAADGALWGYAVVYAIPFTYDLRPTLVLKELYVGEASRSAGVGRALMDAVLAHARAGRYGRIRWQVLPTNDRAQAFYRRFGGAPETRWDHWIHELDVAA